MNLKIESQKLIFNLDYLRDWVRKSLDNIRINRQYSRLPQDDNSLSSEIKEAIRLALIKDNEFSNFTLKNIMIFASSQLILDLMSLTIHHNNFL